MMAGEMAMPDNDLKLKARSAFSNDVSNALSLFDQYGMGIFIPEAHAAIVTSAERFVAKMMQANKDKNNAK